MFMFQNQNILFSVAELSTALQQMQFIPTRRSVCVDMFCWNNVLAAVWKRRRVQLCLCEEFFKFSLFFSSLPSQISQKDEQRKYY